MDSSLRMFIYANEPFLNLVGSDNNHLIGKNIEYTPVSMVFDELFEGFIENIKEGVLGKEWSGELVLRLQRISTCFAGSSRRFLMMGEKECQSFLRTSLNEKFLKRRLLQSRSDSRSLVEMLPQSIWECDDRGNVTYVNQRTYEMYGYDYEDVKRE